MYGRYGNDNLNRFLIYLSLALVLINLFIHIRAISVLTILLLIVIFSRAWSRCFDKRAAENAKFLELKGKFFGGKGNYNYSSPNEKKGFGGFKKQKNDGKRVLICPYCKEKLRVPVGAVRIKIDCPHCHQQFEETV
ncbi:MAG: hypothetical protein HUJ79_07235 [Firmicutes bacterium]|nr:hypothetical protein [Bacillota bacterium]